MRCMHKSGSWHYTRDADQSTCARACTGAGAGQAAGGLDAPADVIVTEIFDSELIGEGILPTMRHAVAHLLQVRCGCCDV